MTTEQILEGDVCSMETFKGTNIQSSFDSYLETTRVSYWSKDTFDLGGEIQFLESNEVSELTLELISLRGDERFIVAAKLPSCERR